MFNKIDKAIVAIATAITLAAPAANAAPSNFAAHQALSTALGRAGVSLYVNPERCATMGAMGWYAGNQREIVVCQENSNPGDPEGRWSEEDLDTLRHEAQHFIQDCMVGGNHDHTLSPVYQEPVQLAQNVLTNDHIQWIIGAYRNQGADDHTIVLELEAFAVAAINDPWEQVQDIATYCL